MVTASSYANNINGSPNEDEWQTEIMRMRVIHSPLPSLKVKSLSPIHWLTSSPLTYDCPTISPTFTEILYLFSMHSFLIFVQIYLIEVFAEPYCVYIFNHSLKFSLILLFFFIFMKLFPVFCNYDGIFKEFLN